jgi:hypothetical protein
MGVAHPPPPPKPLACLVRYYTGTSVNADGAWWLALPDGTRIAYDDGRAKSFEERLDTPDVKDVFSIPYRTGPITPVTEIDHDPGRVRITQLFEATYGSTKEKVDVVPVRLQGQKLLVNRKAVDAFQRVAARLEKIVVAQPAIRPYLNGLGGTFVWRKIAGTQRESPHSFGVSLDINTGLSDYWLWKSQPIVWTSRIPQTIVDAFEAEGFIWGGRWYHYDTMHFEWRPEMLDPSCYP